MGIVLGREEVDVMDELSIYSCDNHLDLRSVPRQLWLDRLPRDLAQRGPRVVTGDGDPMWVCNDRVLGRSGLPGGRAPGPERREPGRPRRRRLPGQRPEAAAGGHGPRRHLGIGHLRPDPLTLSIPEPDLAGRLLRGLERLGDRGVQRVRSDRLCALPFLPTFSPEASVAELERVVGKGPPGRDHRRVRHRCRRSGLGPPLGGCRAGRRAAQLPHQGRCLPATQLPGGPMAVGGVRHPPPPATGRGTRHHGLLRVPWSATRG